jgi:hypothetical protein
MELYELDRSAAASALRQDTYEREGFHDVFPKHRRRDREISF